VRFASEEAARKELLDEADGALQMATRLTRQLLTFARGGAPVRKVVSLAPMVERATRFALSGSNVAPRFELPPELWACECDEGQMEQVIQNIVINALESMPAGGTLHVRGANVVGPAPGLPASIAAGRHVALSVEDAGHGIPPELLSRIFDPYVSTKGRGSGLGLATAHSIVRQHRGAIGVESRLGQGSTFTVYLPATEGEARRLPAERLPTAMTAARVLVMDDEPMLRRVARSLLVGLGHEVELAAEGAEAVLRYSDARASGRPFDLVILDLTVPGGQGGVAALEALKRIDPGVKAIVSSGYSDDAGLAHASTLGFVAALPKPYTVAELKRAIELALAARHPPTAS
jgi:CheY-like chemotaxis protein